MTLTYDERGALVDYRKERALSTIQEAKDNVELKHWNLVANRLYYATYYAQTALLLSKGLTALSHAGVKSMISLHFVKTNLLSQQDKSLLQNLFSMRQTGDYDDIYDWTEEDIKPLIESTENIVKKILNLIES